MRFTLLYLTVLVNYSFLQAQSTSAAKVIEFNQSECDNTSDPYRLKPRIIYKKQHGDTLDLTIGLAATCCLRYSPDIRYSQDTVYVDYRSGDNQDACLCLCCYQFQHKVTGITKRDVVVKLGERVIEVSTEKYRTYPVSFEMVKGDTINRIDKYGMKQGIWVFKNSLNCALYKNDETIGKVQLYNNGKVKYEENFVNGITKEYYESGKIKRECGNSAGGCVYWNEKGKVISK